MMFWETMTTDKGIDVVFGWNHARTFWLGNPFQNKTVQPGIPVVMITKMRLKPMEEAIGSQIDDYLIKPVNPNQILLTLKKLIDNKRLISEKTKLIISRNSDPYWWKSTAAREK